MSLNKDIPNWEEYCPLKIVLPTFTFHIKTCENDPESMISSDGPSTVQIVFVIWTVGRKLNDILSLIDVSTTSWVEF